MQLTETAAAKVKELLQQEGKPEVALRVAAQPGGCCGFQYSMLPTDSVSDQDHTEEQYGVRVVIDKDSAPLLSEATIDFKDSLERSGFAIENPLGAEAAPAATSVEGRGPGVRPHAPPMERPPLKMYSPHARGPGSSGGLSPRP